VSLVSDTDGRGVNHLSRPPEHGHPGVPVRRAPVGVSSL